MSERRAGGHDPRHRREGGRLEVAVSYALNGRPESPTRRASESSVSRGSAGTRTGRHGRSPPRGRTPAARPRAAANTLALEPFYMEFIAGAESELSSRAMALTIQLVRDVPAEIEVYRRWWGEHRVDGVLMVDLRVDDPRVEELVRLGLPTVVVGGPLPGHSRRLARRGIRRRRGRSLPRGARPRRIAHVAGFEEFVTRQRMGAFREAEGTRPATGDGDDRLLPGERRRRDPGLTSPEPPTAIIFDSDLLAVTGLGVAQQMGFAVPGDVLDRRLGRLPDQPGRPYPR